MAIRRHRPGLLRRLRLCCHRRRAYQSPLGRLRSEPSRLDGVQAPVQQARPGPAHLQRRAGAGAMCVGRFLRPSLWPQRTARSAAGHPPHRTGATAHAGTPVPPAQSQTRNDRPGNADRTATDQRLHGLVLRLRQSPDGRDGYPANLELPSGITSTRCPPAASTKSPTAPRCVRTTTSAKAAAWWPSANTATKSWPPAKCKCRPTSWWTWAQPTARRCKSMPATPGITRPESPLTPRPRHRHLPAPAVRLPWHFALEICTAYWDMLP